MVCFEVTPESFHQVAEVLSKDKTRLSVGGWFHGKSDPRPPKHKENLSHLHSPVSISEGNIKIMPKLKVATFYQNVQYF